MNTISRGCVLLLLATPAWAFAQTTQDASRIGGSIFPTVIRPAPLPAIKPTPSAHPSFATQGVAAVCLASSAYAERCPAQPNMAFCDVEGVGLQQCLSRYATALVKQPEGAKRALLFVVRDARGTTNTVTVLASAAQSDEDIAKAALEGMPEASIVAMQMPDAKRLPLP
jgi:hypothetical protein